LQRLWARALFQAPKVLSVERVADETKNIWTLRSIWETYRQFILGVCFGLIPTIAILAFSYSSGRGKVNVIDLKFCDEAGFSSIAQKCHVSSSHFPTGTSRIYVSFDVNNAYDGQPFDRKWYYKSRQISAMSSYFDSAWPGFTFYGDGQNAFENGKYDLRIIIDDETTTRSFVVGTFDPSKVNPNDFKE